jgi:hypothetical protein
MAAVEPVSGESRLRSCASVSVCNFVLGDVGHGKWGTALHRTGCPGAGWQSHYATWGMAQRLRRQLIAELEAADEA